MTEQHSDLVALLRTFDTPTISDAGERAGHDCYVVTNVTPQTVTTAIAGEAITVQLGPADEALTPSTRHLGTTAVEAATSDHLIVVAHQGRSDCAGWGGNLSRGARHRGCAGTIVDGAVRDITEATMLGYPVYASSTTPRTARGRAVEIACQEPILFAGAPVDPADYVIADATGIVIIPRHAILDVLKAAAVIAAGEEQIATRLAGGAPISNAMGHDYEHMLETDPITGGLEHLLPRQSSHPSVPGWPSASLAEPGGR